MVAEGQNAGSPQAESLFTRGRELDPLSPPTRSCSEQLCTTLDIKNSDKLDATLTKIIKLLTTLNSPFISLNLQQSTLFNQPSVTLKALKTLANFTSQHPLQDGEGIVRNYEIQKKSKSQI